MDATTVALIAAFAGPLGAYLVAVRRFSGKIASSDASQLWEESRSIREWSQGRINALNEMVGRLEARVGALEGDNSALVRENRKLVMELRDHDGTITDLRVKVRSLNEELTKARARIAELEANGA